MNILMTLAIITPRKNQLENFRVVWGYLWVKFVSVMGQVWFLGRKLHVFDYFFAIFNAFSVNFEWILSVLRDFWWAKINTKIIFVKNIHIFSTIKKSTFKMCILCTYWIICIWHIWQIGLESQILAPIWNIVLGNISTRIYYPHLSNMA